MEALVFNAPEHKLLEVAGTDARFPVRRVYCIGRNYAAHAIEMGHDPSREDPFFFQKNPDNLLTTGSFPFPSRSSDVHYEAEIAVCLKSGGRNINQSTALETVFGYALALDMTRRDLQGIAKKAGRPWEIGKAFENSAPIGPIYKTDDVGHISSGTLALTVNGIFKQAADVNRMIWKVPQMIAYLSEYFELAAGDIILSGTPEGVGPIAVGDVMKVSHPQLGEITVEVVSPRD